MLKSLPAPVPIVYVNVDNSSFFINASSASVEIFLGLIETIARMRDVKIFMLGNAVTQFNPYFMFFNLTLPYNNDIKTFKDGLILVQYMNNEEYRKTKKESKFGKLVSGTEYEDYAINNSFRLENNDFISKKYASTGGHQLYKITEIHKDGTLTLMDHRPMGESEEE